MLKIGVLSYQGSFAEHISMLERLNGVEPSLVKYIDQLNSLDAIILPGGESTAIGNMLQRFGLLGPLKKRIEGGMPVWGTCAGMILLAKQIQEQSKTHLSVMDIVVRRNAYGGQLNSFETELKIEGFDKPCDVVFVRAPWIESVGGDVSILAKHNDRIVAARQANMLATSFHPELTKNTAFHEYFANIAKQAKK